MKPLEEIIMQGFDRKEDQSSVEMQTEKSIHPQMPKPAGQSKPVDYSFKPQPIPPYKPSKRRRNDLEDYVIGYGGGFTAFALLLSGFGGGAYAMLADGGEKAQKIWVGLMIFGVPIAAVGGACYGMVKYFIDRRS